VFRLFGCGVIRWRGGASSGSLRAGTAAVRQQPLLAMPGYPGPRKPVFAPEADRGIADDTLRFRSVRDIRHTQAAARNMTQETGAIRAQRGAQTAMTSHP